MSKIEPVFPNETSRRHFISRITQAGLGAAAMAYLAGRSSGEAGTSDSGQHDTVLGAVSKEIVAWAP